MNETCFIKDIVYHQTCSKSFIVISIHYSVHTLHDAVGRADRERETLVNFGKSRFKTEVKD